MVTLEFNNKEIFTKQHNGAFVLCNAKRKDYKLYKERINKLQKFTHDTYHMIQNTENFFLENVQKHDLTFINDKRAVLSFCSGGFVCFLTSYLVNEKKFTEHKFQLQITHRKIKKFT